MNPQRMAIIKSIKNDMFFLGGVRLYKCLEKFILNDDIKVLNRQCYRVSGCCINDVMNTLRNDGVEVIPPEEYETFEHSAVETENSSSCTVQMADRESSNRVEMACN